MPDRVDERLRGTLQVWMPRGPCRPEAYCRAVGGHRARRGAKDGDSKKPSAGRKKKKK